MPTPDEMAAAMVANLKAKTGKSLPEWLKITKKSKLEKHGQLVKMLKSDHGVTHGFANLIAHKTLESDAGSAREEDLVASQYSDKKEGLKPIYEALIAVVSKFGKDIEISPKRAYVSLRRSKQFALIQPSTATRVDIGIQLKGEAPAERLEASGSFNQMCSHRVRVTAKSEIDAELVGWLKKAYESA